MEELFAEAREVRDRQFGKHVFAYGFVYFSTYCHNNCTFCYYRRTNSIDRYRKSPEEIISLAADLKDAGIDLVDLTMGEDEHMYADDYSELLEIISGVKKLGISIMAGEKGKNGVLKIFTKASKDNVLYVVDGKPATSQEVKDIAPSKISNVVVLKRGSKAAMDYGEVGKTHDICIVKTK